ncbi:MAG: GntR family transcriptional regulator [Hyphomicrobiaceae bacterium]|nr:GntR family transcriptional regulator [Hyphomicrobiaceae bacterium]
MAVVPQLERERAYDKLIRLILSGSFAPGDPISERGLSEKLKIGRTPIREALRDLERSGLVEVVPARGTFVKRPSLSDMREIFEIRYALEGMAAFTAAKRGATPDLLAFREKFEELIRNPEKSTAADIDELGARFHQKIIEATGNRTLQKVFKQFRLPFLLESSLVHVRRLIVIKQLVDEHLAILDAIERRDAPGAQSLMCAHLMSGWRMRLDMFNSLEDFEPLEIEAMDAG